MAKTKNREWIYRIADKLVCAAVEATYALNERIKKNDPRTEKTFRALRSASPFRCVSLAGPRVWEEGIYYDRRAAVDNAAIDAATGKAQAMCLLLPDEDAAAVSDKLGFTSRFAHSLQLGCHGRRIPKRIYAFIASESAYRENEELKDLVARKVLKIAWSGCESARGEYDELYSKTTDADGEPDLAPSFALSADGQRAYESAVARKTIEDAYAQCVRGIPLLDRKKISARGRGYADKARYISMCADAISCETLAFTEKDAEELAKIAARGDGRVLGQRHRGYDEAAIAMGKKQCAPLPEEIAKWTDLPDHLRECCDAWCAADDADAASAYAVRRLAENEAWRRYENEIPREAFAKDPQWRDAAARMRYAFQALSEGLAVEDIFPNAMETIESRHEQLYAWIVRR